MSAREELVESMLPTLHSPARGEEEAVNRLIDAFAHELAEEIRAAYDGEGPDEDNWIRTPFDAADLIDPKKVA